MFFDFPEDRTTYHLDQQYMLGDSLLVAPVFAEDNEEIEFYLPAGTWTSFWSPSDVIVGPKWVKRTVAYDDIPVFVKENSVLALGKSGLGRPDYDYTKDVEVRVYGLGADGASASAFIPTGKGAERAATLKATNKAGKIVVDVTEGSLSSWAAAHFHAGNGSTPVASQGATVTIA